MSSSEETVIKIESGLGLREKGDKKYRFNPPAGTLILTDRRLIFAQSDEGLAKRMVAAGLFGSMALKSMMKVKPEELDKALERPESFQLSLPDILEAKIEKQITTPFLVVRWNAPENPKVVFYKVGVSSGLKGLFDEWIKAIQDARKTTPTSQSDNAEKICIGCDQKIPENVNFCPKCGVKQ